MNSTDNQSLLAFIHNWRCHNLPRGQRPQEAAAGERCVVYAIGALLLAGIGVVSGIRRRDSRLELFAINGLLIGLALVVSPIVHNFYYLLMLPLIAALLHRALVRGAGLVPDWKLLLPMLVFMLTDMMARLPVFGGWLRDLGLPLLSLIYLMWAGAAMLLEPECPAERQSETALRP